MRKIKVIALTLFLIMVCVSIDFGFNFLWALVPESNDGIGLHALFNVFGDNGWSLSRYLSAFQRSIWITFALLIVNILLRVTKNQIPPPSE